MDSKPSASTGDLPPPLPPRQSSGTTLSPYQDAPPPYEAISSAGPSTDGPWSGHDSRTSSTQSLVPSESNQQNDRRKLLLIYIHGFMGNETSFRSFPAHVHHLLTVLLAETHVVHTKIYPRYRSKRNISYARDDFSKWLEPHEDERTDVVLLGHSMGGLLSAEVVLMPASPPANRAFKHRILGTINFDVPFLGMHPGVVKSGLASMFSPAEEQKDKWSPEPVAAQGDDGASTASGAMSPISPLRSRSDTFWQPQQPDPNFNPSFNNDVVLPMRKGWSNALHFVNKHSGHILKATKQLVTSHMEFGGAMANYPELRARYGKIRTLEVDDPNVRKTIVSGGQTPPRVRFVNYYTASTGRLKRPKSPADKAQSANNAGQVHLSEDDARGRSAPTTTSGSDLSRSPSPRISLEEHSDEGVVQKVPDIPSSDDEAWEEAAETLTIGDPEQDSAAPEPRMTSPGPSSLDQASLPPIPEIPTAPPPLDVSYIQDTSVRKLVEKEHSRAVKAYEKAIKDREKAIRDREKLMEKQQRKARKDSEKSMKEAEMAKRKAEATAGQSELPKELTHNEREQIRLEQERQRMEAEARRMRGESGLESAPEPSSATLTTPECDDEEAPTPPMQDPSTVPARENAPTTRPANKQHKEQWPKKDRKFCSLPPKDSNGERDPLWVRIYMENVDEVGAHCGLFFVDERYEKLVGEVADRIETWIREDVNERIGEIDWKRELD